MVAEQAKMQSMQAEYQIKLQYEQAMHQMKMEQILAQTQSKEREEQIRGEYDLAEQRIQTSGKTDIQAKMEDRKDQRMREEKTMQSELIEQQKSENPTPKQFTKQEPNLEDLLG